MSSHWVWGTSKSSSSRRNSGSMRIGSQVQFSLIIGSCCVPSSRHPGDTSRDGLSRAFGHLHLHLQYACFDWQVSFFGG